MPKKLTLTVDAEVYDGLRSVVGRRRISRFLNDLARPHVVSQNPSLGYAAMAADETREAEAEAWAEALLNDVAENHAVAADPSPRRGEVWLVTFDPSVGGEIQKTRPPVALSNDAANAVLNRVQVVPTQARSSVSTRPKLTCRSAASAARPSDQITTASKRRLQRTLGMLARDDLGAVVRVVRLQLRL